MEGGRVGKMEGRRERGAEGYKEGRKEARKDFERETVNQQGSVKGIRRFRTDAESERFSKNC